MHDAQYRAEVARQNTTYNQPSYTSFYLASDTDWAKVPVPTLWMPGVLSGLETAMDGYKNNDELTGPLAVQLENSLKQARHHLEKDSIEQALKFMDKYVAELNKKNNEKHISASAKLNLTNKAQLLINMLAKN